MREVEAVIVMLGQISIILMLMMVFYLIMMERTKSLARHSILVDVLTADGRARQTRVPVSGTGEVRFTYPKKKDGVTHEWLYDEAYVRITSWGLVPISFMETDIPYIIWQVGDLVPSLPKGEHSATLIYDASGSEYKMRSEAFAGAINNSYQQASMKAGQAFEELQDKLSKAINPAVIYMMLGTILILLITLAWFTYETRTLTVNTTNSIEVIKKALGF